MSPLLNAGVELMLVGMGTVFFFLTLLVAATRLMSKILSRIAPAEQLAAASIPNAVGGVALTGADFQDEEVAVITATIAHHNAHKA